MKKVKSALLLLSVALLFCALTCISAFAEDEVTTEEGLRAAITAASTTDITEITLGADITLTSNLDITGNKVSLTGGKTITLENGTSIIVHASATLTLDNVTVTHEDVDGVKSDQGFKAYDNGHVILKENAVIKNINAVNGVFQIETGGLFTMEGGSIQDCTASWRGIVASDQMNAKITITGGQILRCNNYALQVKGVANVSNLTVTGCTGVINVGSISRTTVSGDEAVTTTYYGSVTVGENVTASDITGNYIIYAPSGATVSVSDGFKAATNSDTPDGKNYINKSVVKALLDKKGTYIACTSLEGALGSGGLGESDGDKATNIIYLYDDATISTALILNNRKMTIVGNGNTLTAESFDANGNYTDILLKDVTFCAKEFSLGNKGKLTFGDKAVLTTGGEETTYAVYSKWSDADTTITFENGSSIENVNCTTAVVYSDNSITVNVKEGFSDKTPANTVIIKLPAASAVTADAATGLKKVGTGNLYYSAASEYVAQIGEGKYVSFLGAIESAKGATVTLIKDCEYNGGINGSASYTLEGAGKTLTVKENLVLVGSDTESSTVTMQNVTIVLGGNLAGGVGITEYHSSLTMNNVTFKASVGVAKAVSVLSSSTLTMKNTNVTATGKLAAVVYLESGSAFNSEGSTFKNITFENKNGDIGEATGVVYANGGTVNLKDTEISGNSGVLGAGVVMKNTVTFTMENGAIKNNSAWCVSGIKKLSQPASLTFKGTATVTDNMVKSSEKQANVFIATDVDITIAEGFSGKLGFIADSNNNAIAEGAQIGKSITGTIKTVGTITADNTEFIGYIKDGKLTFVKKPILTVTYDSGKYEKDGATYGVVRAMSEFSNTTDNTVIESCGTYFVKTTPGAGAVPADGNKKVEVKNATVSDGNGIQMDCYEMQTDASVVAVSWYKLAGVDEYVYTIGAVAKVDTEKTVEYTEA